MGAAVGAGEASMDSVLLVGIAPSLAMIVLQPENAAAVINQQTITESLEKLFRVLIVSPHP